MTNEEIKSAIRAAYEVIGYKPTQGTWGDHPRLCGEEDKECCGLGALRWADRFKDQVNINRRASAAQFLGRTEEWVDGFIMGFDGHNAKYLADHTADYVEGFYLGREVAVEFNLTINES